ncbi:MAG: SMC family ATPase [Methanoregula sp.]|nr:SMC family ATPase [Methanoregula sp.]
MKINRIRLTHFKRFERVDIPIGDGFTAITGPNGSGKSTLLNAFVFALYGVSGGLSADYIVSSFAEPGDRCEVEIDFTYADRPYNILRTFKKNKSVHHDVTLKCDGETRATGVSQVVAEVIKIIGLNASDFSMVFYAKQDDLRSITDIRPGERKEWFSKSFGVNFIKTESDKILKKRSAEIEQAIATLQGELSALTRQDPAELEQVRKDTAELREKVVTLTAMEQDLSAKRAALSIEKQGYDLKTVQQGKLTDQEKTLRNDVAVMMARVVTLTEQGASLAINDQEVQQLEETVAEIPKAREEIEQHRTRKSQVEANAAERRGMPAEIRALDSKSATLKMAIHTLDDSEIELTRLYTTIRTALDISEDVADVDNAVTEFSAYIAEKVTNLTTRIQANEETCNKIKATLETIRKTGPEGTCPICLQQLGEHFADVEREYVARLAEMMVDGDDLDKDLTKALDDTHRVPALKPILDRIMHIHKGLGYREYHEKELTSTTARLTEITARYNELGVQQEKIGYDDEAHLLCQQRLVELEKAQNRYTELTKRSAQQAGIRAQIAELNSQIVSKSTALAEVKAAIDANPIDLSAGPLLTHELGKLDITLKSIAQDLATSIEREKTLTQKAKDLELAAARIGTVNQQLAALREEMEVVTLTRSAIADYVLYIMQVMRSAIEAEVSTILADITDGKYSRVIVDEDFNLLIREGDNQYSLERYSGGEQDVIALSLRMALSNILPKLHGVFETFPFLIDEGLSSLDPERKENTIRALRTQAKRCGQVLNNTHDQDVVGDQTLRVITSGRISTVQAGGA